MKYNYLLVLLLIKSSINIGDIIAASYTCPGDYTVQENSSNRRVKTSKVCHCDDCSNLRFYASTLPLRDYVITRALIKTPLTPPLIDIIYDYAGHSLHQYKRHDIPSNSLHQCSLLHNRENTKTSAIQLLREYAYIERAGLTSRSLSFCLHHIVPREVSFDAHTFNKAALIIFNQQAPQMTTVRSLCDNYCIDFEPEKIIVSSFSRKLSASQGWQLAIESTQKKQITN